MSQELEEQQKIADQIKEQLRLLTAERVRITEQIKILEAKLVVQELRKQVTAIIEENNQLRVKLQRLREKLESQGKILAFEEKVQIALSQKEPSRTHF